MTQIKNWLVKVARWFIDNKYAVFIGLGTFAVPLSGIMPTPQGDVWYAQYLGLFVVFCLGISFVLCRFNILLALLTVFCLFSAMVTAGQHPRAILSLVQVMFSCLAMYGISLLNSRNRQVLLKFLLALVILQGGWVIVQFLNLDPIFNHIVDATTDDTVGFSGSHNQIGLFFADTAPLVLAYCPWLIVLTIIGIWGSTTSTAFISTIISSLTFVLLISKQKRQVATLLVIVAIMSGMVFFTKFENLGNRMLQERWWLIAHTVTDVHTGHVTMRNETMIKEVSCNRWFGYGIGNFIRISPYTQESYITNFTTQYRHLHHRYSHAHNDIVEVLYELGWTGWMTVMLLVLDFIWCFIRSRKTKILNVTFCCVLAHLICAQGIFTVHTAVSATMLIVLYGLYMGEYKEINNEQRSKNGKARSLPPLVRWQIKK